MSSGFADPSFQLTMSDWTRESIRRWAHRSIVVGYRDRFAEIMLAIESALRTSPREWGDPLRALPGLRLVQYRRVYEDLSVVYSVHEIHRIVWLGSVTPLRQSPLWIGEG